MTDWIVTIEYKNQNMENVVIKEYDFIEYCEMLDSQLKSTLVDIENAFYALEGNKRKEDWSEDTKERFKGIRHKILDKANAIRRLPQTLSYKNITPYTKTAGEFLAEQISKLE